MLMRSVLMMLIAIAALSGRAESTVSDVVVSQRWPWSEKVDVDFTLTGEKTDVDVTATWDGQSVPVLIGTAYDAAPGLNRVTWNPAATSYAGQTLTGFSVTVAPALAADHTYLVIDLQNGGVSYRTAPDGDDGKWTDAYKTTKMVFRRIPAGTYQLGMESNQIAKVAGGSIDAGTATAWKRHDITFSSDFYVGVFKMTGAQYNLLKGNSAGTDLTPKSVSYDGIRGSVDEGVNWPSTKYEVSRTSLVAKLREKAGLDWLVDLCQECQWEAAMRAGRTTFWPNGGTMDDSLATLTNVVDEICWRGGSHEVGLKADNGWGIYDPVGIAPEWMLDTVSGKVGHTPKKGLSSGTDPVGVTSSTATDRVIRTDGAKSLHLLLPSYRRVYGHADSVAAARFCIHLKPLNFQN